MFSKTTGTLNQLLAVVSGNLANLSFGTLIGWTLTTSLHLQNPDRTHLSVPPIDDDERSWLISTVFISMWFGAIYISWIADFFGRKRTMCMLSAGHMFCWALNIFATNATELYIANMFAGLVGGGSLAVMPLFIAEIAADQIRGFLGALTMLFYHGGILLAFVAQATLTSHQTSYFLWLLPFVFLASFLSLSLDSPTQLRKENRSEDALQSLQYYSGCRTVAEQSSDHYKSQVDHFKANNFDTEPKAKYFINVKGKLFVCLMLTIIQHLSGYIILLAMAGQINVTGWPSAIISENMTAIVLGICLTMGSVASLLTDKVGRKPLVIISLVGTAMALLALGIGIEWSSNAGDNNWTAYASVVLMAFFLSIGVVTLMPVILTELFHAKIRTLIAPLFIGFGWLFTFVTYKLELVQLVSMAGVAFFTAAICVGTILAVWYMMPETNYKTTNITEKIDGRT